MKRSVGLILAATVLGMAAVGLLLFAGLMVVAGVSLRTHSPNPAPPAFIGWVIYATALVLTALAAWAIATMVGLLFLRSWARYSVLVLGGLLSAVGGLSTVGVVISLLASPMGFPASHPGVSDQAIHMVMAGIAVVYGIVAAIGVWWLIYFNRPSARNLFLRRDPDTGLLRAPLSSSRRPVAITVLGCLLLLAALSCAVFAFLPFPAFLFGFILAGMRGHALYAGLALLTAVTAAGLLRLASWARSVAIIFLLFGCVNTILTMLPWYQGHLRAYMQQLAAQFPALAATQPGGFQLPVAQLIVYGIFGLGLNLFLIWLLHRHRAAFSAPPPLASPPAINQAAT